MSGRFTGKSFGAWITGAALLCTLSGAQLSQAAQVAVQPNAIRQSLAKAGQQQPANTSAPQGQAQRQPGTASPAPVARPLIKAPGKQQGFKPPVEPLTPPVTKGTTTAAVKPAVKPAIKPAATPVGPQAVPVALHESVSRRDPFSPLVGGPASGGGAPQHLPPGKAGLMVSAIRIDGIVKGPGGMIAVVTNGQQRTYFLREGDQLYDGNVSHITLTDVSFHETGKDPFGKPIEHDVSKPLNATPGEQQ
jgi:hypothetical protein